MRKPRHWYCEVYKQNFYYCLGWSATSVSAYLLKYFKYEWKDEHRLGSCIHNADITVLWTYKRNDAAALAHEAVHAANFTLGQAGLIPSYENDEAQAYLVEAIVRNAR